MMNRALVPDMLHCTDHLTVLERQRSRFKFQHQSPLQFHHPEIEDESDCYNFNGAFQGFQGDLGEIVVRSVKPDPWPSDLAGFPPSGYSDSHVNYSISRTASCPPVVPAKGAENLGADGSKKRKVDKIQSNAKVVAEEESKDKRAKTFAEEGDSKITDCTKNKSNSKENSADNSKDNSKITTEVVQKPDYIHVRARRGQATDSHSLAERVRREKISERMKYLQDLVPGCNKITGKAGMLDEIINYVQSLQRQVEFLSMKLAAVNPRLDFNIDNLFAKEIFPPCGTNFASIGMSTTDMTNTAYLHQFNPVQQQQQQITTCGLEMGTNPPGLSLRRTISAPVSNPETFMDSSCFTQMQGSSNWDSDLQNLYSVGFDEGRSTSFPTQPFTGCIETSNLKMEM